MSTRTSTRIAWSLWSVSLVSMAIGVLLFVTSGSTAARGHGGQPLMHLTFILFSTVGALIISRHSGNAIGWFFCVIGLTSALGVNGLGYGYVHYALFGHPGSLPAGEWVAWITGLVNAVGLATAPLVLLLFPTGHVPSRRWEPVVWLVVADAAVNGITIAIQPGPLDVFPAVQNPVGLPGPAGEVASAVNGASSLLLGLLILAGAISVLARLRRARGDERKQIKWFAYDAVLLAVAFGMFFVGPALDPDLAPNGPLNWVLSLLWALAVTGLPVSIGIAILRYRLYDVDLLINRTLVYGALTGSLVVIYYGCVVLLQQILRVAAGQQSDVAIVGSTLAIAALFQPLRRRIQIVIDRRFYRHKYDAARTLASFTAALRDEVDLTQLSDHLVAVVENTTQPKQVSLWFRPGNQEPIRNSAAPGRPGQTSSGFVHNAGE